jgi:hypothetical protein
MAQRLNRGRSFLYGLMAQWREEELSKTGGGGDWTDQRVDGGRMGFDGLTA